MALRKTYVSAEMTDGTEVENLRVLAADKVHAENICQKKNWPLKDGPRLGVALAYAAMKRAGHTDVADVADFLDALADYELTNGEDDTDSPT